MKFSFVTKDDALSRETAISVTMDLREVLVIHGMLVAGVEGLSDDFTRIRLALAWDSVGISEAGVALVLTEFSKGLAEGLRLHAESMK